MPIPVWEVLEGTANTVEGQEHKPCNQLVNLSGRPMDLAGIMRDCARVIREDYDRRLKTSSARNARSVSPQATESERITEYVKLCRQQEIDALRKYAPYVDSLAQGGTSRACVPLVSPERVTAIKAFRRSLALMEEAYGVKLKTDSSGDLLIIDTATKLPSDYEWSAWIDRNGEVHISDWVVEPEAGGKR